MLILIDLDGTLTDTTHPTWAPYRDGQAEVDRSKVSVFPGALDFLRFCKSAGHEIVIVSDSHPRYVNELKQLFGIEAISLADKPNRTKVDDFLSKHQNLSAYIASGDAIIIGDTKLDIELARRLRVPSILITQYCVSDEDVNLRDGIGDTRGNMKMGPTFYATNFQHVTDIISSPTSYLLAVESAFQGGESHEFIKFKNMSYEDGAHGLIRCLARQEDGLCDGYARADKYYQIANPNRTAEFISILGKGIKSYIDFVIASGRIRWDCFTFITDKASTQPPNKMREIFDAVDVNITKEDIFAWDISVQGSLRQQNLYADRSEFLRRYLKIRNDAQITGRSFIVLDDQLTTGATAFYAIKALRDKGARNVLFIPIFQMILNVATGKICPRCGCEMSIKMRRKDGNRFYSCTPPQYGGNGCGYTENIE